MEPIFTWSILLTWIFLCILIGNMGESRKIGYWGAAIVALFFSPLIGFIVTTLSEKKEPRQVNVRLLNTSSPNPISIGDELSKLKKLLDDGVITQEDFMKQKEKLLS